MAEFRSVGFDLDSGGTAVGTTAFEPFGGSQFRLGAGGEAIPRSEAEFAWDSSCFFMIVIFNYCISRFPRRLFLR